MKALTFKQFIFESKYTKLADKYIETDYTPNWRKDRDMGSQRYLNKADNVKLKILKFIFDSGENGRSFKEIQKFYYNLGADAEGKKSRYDYGEYVWNPITQTSTKIPGKGEEYREYNYKKDRGYGGTMLSGDDYYGKPTGILHAHCKKNEDGRWVLTDKKLKNIFQFVDISDDGDIDMIKNLGLLD